MPWLPSPLNIKLINVQGLEFFDGLTKENLNALALALQGRLRARRRRLWLSAAAAVLVVGLAAGAAWYGMRLPTRVPEAQIVSPFVSSLPAGEVLKLAYSGQPPDAAANAIPLRLRLDILGRRKGEPAFRPLKDGDSLASEEDDYLIVTQAFSPGWLYVFQVDTAGNKTWLHPQNGTSPFSSGANPLQASQLIQIPSGAQGRALYLDHHAGIEHIYAVFSATRWPELETALTQPPPAATPAQTAARAITSPLGLATRGVGGARPLDSAGLPHPLSSAEVPITYKGQSLTAPMASQPLIATGSVLAIERWLRHVPGEGEPTPR